jgi:Cu-Zn family superoxide dismutase
MVQINRIVAAYVFCWFFLFLGQCCAEQKPLEKGSKEYIKLMALAQDADKKAAELREQKLKEGKVNTSMAIAHMAGTSEANAGIHGTVNFVEKDGGVWVTAILSDVPNPGQHGFHVHENGSCADEGKAAGGHYNPGHAQHGLLHQDGSEKAHAGDMGNITIDDEGNGSLNVFLPDVHLTGEKNNIIQKAVILHEKVDDFSQPTGNAGGRIGCGIIDYLGL